MWNGESMTGIYSLQWKLLLRNKSCIILLDAFLLQPSKEVQVTVWRETGSCTHTSAAREPQIHGAFQAEVYHSPWKTKRGSTTRRSTSSWILPSSIQWECSLHPSYTDKTRCCSPQFSFHVSKHFRKIGLFHTTMLIEPLQSIDNEQCLENYN